MSAGLDVAAEAARHRAAGALAKPFAVDHLLHTVARFVPRPCP
jgi:DNA-binding NtrC family response regulator